MERVLLNPSKLRNEKLSKRYGDAQILQAVIAARGRLALAAQKLGCTHKAVWDAKNRNPVIAQAIKEQRELFIDIAEDSLEEAVKERQGWAVCFTLKTLGRERGFIENQTNYQQVIIQPQDAPEQDPYQLAAQTIMLLMQQGILSPAMLQHNQPIEVGINGAGRNNGREG